MRATFSFAACVVILFACGRVSFERDLVVDAQVADDSGVVPPDADVGDSGVRDAGPLDGGTPAATITSIEPTADITGRAWDTPLLVRGTGFATGAVVAIGNEPCDTTTFVDADTLRCTSVAALAIGPMDVEVRMPSGGGPRQIGGFTSLGQPVVWLRGDFVPGVDGMQVDRWPDRSGFGNHGIQSTALRQPVLRTTSSIGRPVITFDDGDGTADFFVMTDAPSLRPATITIVAVAEMTRITSFAKIVSRTYRSDGTHNAPFQTYSMGISRDATGSPYFDCAEGGALTMAEHDGQALGNGFGTLIGVYDGTTVSQFYRGAATGTSNNLLLSGALDYSSGMTVDVAIGIRSSYSPQEALIGSIAELLLYGEGLDAPSRDAISQYLDDRYGL